MYLLLFPPAPHPLSTVQYLADRLCTVHTVLLHTVLLHTVLLHTIHITVLYTQYYYTPYIILYILCYTVLYIHTVHTVHIQQKQSIHPSIHPSRSPPHPVPSRDAAAASRTFLRPIIWQLARPCQEIPDGRDGVGGGLESSSWHGMAWDGMGWSGMDGGLSSRVRPVGWPN